MFAHVVYELFWRGFASQFQGYTAAVGRSGLRVHLMLRVLDM